MSNYCIIVIDKHIVQLPVSVLFALSSIWFQNKINSIFSAL